MAIDALEMMRKVRENGMALSEIDFHERSDYPEICRAAFEQNHVALVYIPHDIQEMYPDMCPSAVQQDPRLIIVTSKEVQNQFPDMCKYAVENWYGYESPLRFISPTVLTEHPEICQYAIDHMKEYTENPLKDIPSGVLEKHPEMYETAISQDPYSIQYIDGDVQRKNPQLCVKAIENSSDVLSHGNVLAYIDEKVLEEHPEMYVMALKKSPLAMHYIPVKAQEDPNILKTVVESTPIAFYELAPQVKEAHPEICSEMVKQDGMYLGVIPASVQMKNQQICIDALEQNSNAIIKIAPEVRENPSPELIEAMEKAHEKNVEMGFSDGIASRNNTDIDKFVGETYDKIKGESFFRPAPDLDKKQFEPGKDLDDDNKDYFHSGGDLER